MNPQTEILKLTTREVRITREMTVFDFVKSVRGAVTAIAASAGVSVQAVSAVLHGKKKSKAITAEIEKWVRRELARRAA